MFRENVLRRLRVGKYGPRTVMVLNGDNRIDGSKAGMAQGLVASRTMRKVLKPGSAGLHYEELWTVWEEGAGQRECWGLPFLIT